MPTDPAQISKYNEANFIQKYFLKDQPKNFFVIFDVLQLSRAEKNVDHKNGKLCISWKKRCLKASQI